ncbi:hypothetical protein IDM36_15925 [Enterobacter mori]|uniref:Uncharacterized protein n=1 Tax=Enterobacter mori TaxID=539813 RepID=A0A7T0GZC9_9ENTR|nr:hypothetical protein [Enterobacter mori]ELZ1137679.1 hypothetical protein [Escherichia coli]QPJ99391.1 hypothetical protein IDM36_15925 [Enterobacter mori]
MYSEKYSFLEKVHTFSQIASTKEKCEYVSELLEDICRVEDEYVIYSEVDDSFQFFSMGGYCCMRLTMCAHGYFERFELTCN